MYWTFLLLIKHECWSTRSCPTPILLQAFSRTDLANVVQMLRQKYILESWRFFNPSKWVRKSNSDGMEPQSWRHAPSPKNLITNPILINDSNAFISQVQNKCSLRSSNHKISIKCGNTEQSRHVLVNLCCTKECPVTYVSDHRRVNNYAS